MVLKTKFDIGQKVWFRKGSSVMDGIVYSMDITVNLEIGWRVKYTIQYSESDGVYLDESKVFATREEAEAYGNR